MEIVEKLYNEGWGWVWEELCWVWVEEVREDDIGWGYGGGKEGLSVGGCEG